MAPAVKQLTEAIFQVTSEKGVSVHATTKPAVPYPLRASREDVSYIDGRSFANQLREIIGIGTWPASYITHDLFVDENGISPLSSQLKCLCRINLSGKLEVREEEIIYNPIQHIKFQYWMTNEDNAIEHHEMMKLINDKKRDIHQNIIDAFTSIDKYLMKGLEHLYSGKYPREIWDKLDMINVANKQDCL